MDLEGYGLLDFPGRAEVSADVQPKKMAVVSSLGPTRALGPISTTWRPGVHITGSLTVVILQL